MSLLIVGIAVWCLAHLFAAALPESRRRLVARLGTNAYRGIFAMVILLSLVLIVLGWKGSTPRAMYAPPLLGSPIVSALVYVGIVLFVAAPFTTNIKKFLRHPQLTGVVVWGIAHLLANGEQRSILLFGVLSIWALVEMVLINRREGSWKKPAPASIASDLIAVAVGSVAFAVLLVAHPWLAGVAAVPGWS